MAPPMLLAFFLLLAVARAQDAVDPNDASVDGFIAAPEAAIPGCLFNSTVCTCRPSSSPGTCYRHSSGPSDNALCSVDSCASDGGFVCDCLGTQLCALAPCGAWQDIDPSEPAPEIGSQDEGCHYVEDSVCINRVVEEEPAPGTAAPVTTEPLSAATSATTAPTLPANPDEDF